MHMSTQKHMLISVAIERSRASHTCVYPYLSLHLSLHTHARYVFLYIHTHATYHIHLCIYTHICGLPDIYISLYTLFLCVSKKEKKAAHRWIHSYAAQRFDRRRKVGVWGAGSGCGRRRQRVSICTFTPVFVLLYQ